MFETAFPGGQIVSASWVENYPGFPDGVSGAGSGRPHVPSRPRTPGAEFHNISPVEAIRRNGQDFVLTVDGKEIDARVVILATGAIPKKLGIPGEADFTGRGVSWCATCDGPLYHDKTVAVIGGGDSATQEVALPGEDRQRGASHPPARGTAGHRVPAGRVLLQSRRSTMHLAYTVAEIVGESGKVAGLRLVSKADGSEKVLPVDGVFEFVGVDAQSGLVTDLCELDEAGFVKVDRNGVTSCPGLYAAGDVTDYELKQVVTACARGAFAAFHAAHYLEARALGALSAAARELSTGAASQLLVAQLADVDAPRPRCRPASDRRRAASCRTGTRSPRPWRRCP